VTPTVTATAGAAQTAGLNSTAECQDNSRVVGGAAGVALGAALLAALDALAFVCIRRPKQAIATDPTEGFSGYAPSMLHAQGYMPGYSPGPVGFPTTPAAYLNASTYAT